MIQFFPKLHKFIINIPNRETKDFIKIISKLEILNFLSGYLKRFWSLINHNYFLSDVTE